MAEVKLQNLSKTYPGGIEAVRNVNLDIQDGEFVVLVGPSGCGKSTTLRMIAGLEDVSSGTIIIGGRIVNDIPPKDRDIAMVFQNYALYPHMTVRENMAFGLKLRRIPEKEIKSRIAEASEILQLNGLLDRRPKSLSGGQRQRVAVGRAIVRKPAVFLFDEPISNLDAKLRVQMRMEIGRLHRRLGATMIYVTHDQVEAMTMGQRIAVMKDGAIQQATDPLTLYDRPANRFVAGFIGTPPMNLLDGKITANGKLTFEGPDGIRIQAPERYLTALSKYAGKSITLGLRPEDIGSPAAEQTAGAPRLRARIEMIEPMGSESYVHLKAGDCTIICRVDAHSKLTAGVTAEPAVYMEKAHFFDTGTGALII